MQRNIINSRINNAARQSHRPPRGAKYTTNYNTTANANEKPATEKTETPRAILIAVAMRAPSDTDRYDVPIRRARAPSAPSEVGAKIVERFDEALRRRDFRSRSRSRKRRVQNSLVDVHRSSGALAKKLYSDPRYPCRGNNGGASRIRCAFERAARLAREHVNIYRG